MPKSSSSKNYHELNIKITTTLNKPYLLASIPDGYSALRYLAALGQESDVQLILDKICSGEDFEDIDPADAIKGYMEGGRPTQAAKIIDEINAASNLFKGDQFVSELLLIKTIDAAIAGGNESKHVKKNCLNLLNTIQSSHMRLLIADEMDKRFKVTSFTRYNTIINSVNKIANRFTNSPFTSQKTHILKSFLKFYAEHRDSMPPGALVEAWAIQYKTVNNNLNPFAILNQQRRKCCKLFTPAHTDSIKLFHKFLDKDYVSPGLREMMKVTLPNEKESQSKVLLKN